MTYDETLQYLYTQTPVFERSGASAYKPGLDTIIALDRRLNHPHRSYHTLHVGGSNGKGSVAHVLAAVLQQAGYKVGLYTSPHLLDFRERIRINGQMIDKEYVTDFVGRHRSFFEPLRPSFFELVSAMAFAYFDDKKVDIAVIEVGLGGRLDSTNIITPLLSIITNVSKEHTAQLGDTLEQIAFQKAGIIKEGVPVIVGEVTNKSVETVFCREADAMRAPIYFADKEKLFLQPPLREEDGSWTYESADYGTFHAELKGAVQIANTQTTLCALRELNKQLANKLTAEVVAEGFRNVTLLTHLRGRWDKLRDAPRVIADIGHNPGAWEYLTPAIEDELKKRGKAFIIIGFSADKDVDQILCMMPPNASYLITQAQCPRAMPVERLATKAAVANLKTRSFPSVSKAIAYALAKARNNDLIFIGGSNFIVAEALPLVPPQQ